MVKVRISRRSVEDSATQLVAMYCLQLVNLLGRCVPTGSCHAVDQAARQDA